MLLLCVDRGRVTVPFSIQMVFNKPCSASLLAETYRFDQSIQVIHYKGVRIHVVQVLKLFQQGLVVHYHVWRMLTGITHQFVHLSISYDCASHINYVVVIARKLSRTV